MSLTPAETVRYRRHLLLRDIGGQGQGRLKSSKVVLIGAGGLGCPILVYLAAAGVGHLTVVDDDAIELSNLQRQILFTTDDIGRPKAEVAARRVSALNPDIHVAAKVERMTAETADGLIEGADLVIEGVDRFAPRFVLNEGAVRLGVPLLSAAIGRFDGQVALFRNDGTSACYRCFVPEADDDEAVCEAEGVLGAAAGVVGTLAAVEAVKFLTDHPRALSSELLLYQGLDGVMRRVTVPKDRDCPVCQKGE